MENLKKTQRLRNIAIVLIALQLVFKIWVELIKSHDLLIDLVIVDSLFWSGTLAWVVLLPLLIQKHRTSYLAASVFGVLNGIVGALFPTMGVCHHHIVGFVIFVHSLLIAVFSYWAYRRMPKS
jgi:hypothetical protein